MTEYFGLDGQKLTDSKGAVCSKTKFSSGNESYAIAYINTGSEAGFMVNPQSPYYNEAVITGYDKARDKPMIELRTVPKEAYDYYQKFIETKNTSYIRHAERAV